MKKYLVFAILSVLFLGTFSSCNKDEDINTFAKVMVKESGQPQTAVSVYMFRDNKGPNTPFFTPFNSDRTVVTESDGVATFNLQDTFDLEIIDSQTTLYFGIFDLNDNVLDYTAITIEKGQTKSATISY
jgi:hypothetical protein